MCRIIVSKKYGRRKNNIGKTSRWEKSSPERGTGRKGSKSGAPAKIGRYHKYVTVDQTHSKVQEHKGAKKFVFIPHIRTDLESASVLVCYHLLVLLLVSFIVVFFTFYICTK